MKRMTGTKIETTLSASRVFLFCLGVFVSGAGGCSGYRLGSALPTGIRSVHVPTFVNKTGEPQIEVATTQAAIQEFQRDGTLSIANQATADVILAVTLAKYELVALRYDADRAKTGREYRMKITADIVFKRKGAAAAMVRKRVVGDSTFEVVGSLVASKRSALPQTARNLAHKIVRDVVEFW